MSNQQDVLNNGEERSEEEIPTDPDMSDEYIAKNAAYVEEHDSDVLNHLKHLENQAPIATNDTSTTISDAPTDTFDTSGPTIDAPAVINDTSTTIPDAFTATLDNSSLAIDAPAVTNNTATTIPNAPTATLYTPTSTFRTNQGYVRPPRPNDYQDDEKDELLKLVREDRFQRVTGKLHWRSLTEEFNRNMKRQRSSHVARTEQSIRSKIVRSKWV